MDRRLLLAMPKEVRPASAFGERLTALRKARRLTQVQLAQALNVTTDELLGINPTRTASLGDAPEARRLWRKFQQVMTLLEKDRRAVIRLVNPLVTVKAASKDRDARGRRATG